MPRREYPQADPPGYETCLVYLIVFAFLLGAVVWIVLHATGGL